MQSAKNLKFGDFVKSLSYIRAVADDLSPVPIQSEYSVLGPLAMSSAWFLLSLEGKSQVRKRVNSPPTNQKAVKKQPTNQIEREPFQFRPSEQSHSLSSKKAAAQSAYRSGGRSV